MTWFLVAFMLTANGWVLAPEKDGWSQVPYADLDSCISQRDYLNSFMQLYAETRGKYNLECLDHMVSE